MKQDTRQSGLYRPEFEHDNCGIGAIVNSKGQKKPPYCGKRVENC